MKDKLANAFKQVLNTKPFNKITIKAICDECDVGRQTFYYHFQDKYELVTYIYNQDVKTGIAACKSNEWTTNLSEIFKQINLNRNFYQKVFGTKGQNSLTNYLYEYNVKLYRNILIHSGTVNVIDEDLVFAIECHSYACVNMTKRWVSGEFDYNYHEIAHMLIHAMPKELRKQIIHLQLPGTIKQQSNTANHFVFGSY